MTVSKQVMCGTLPGYLIALETTDPTHPAELEAKTSRRQDKIAHKPELTRSLG